MKISHVERIEALEKRPVSPIQPDEHIAEALRRVAIRQYVQLLRQEIETHHERNVLSLQQLATTTASLKISLTLLETYISSKTAKRLHKGIDKLLLRIEAPRLLDTIMRDLLVMGEGSTDRRTISSLIARLDAQRLVGKQKLYSYLSGKKYRKFLDRFEMMLVQPLSDVVETDVDDKPHQLAHVRPVMTIQYLAMVRHYGTTEQAYTIERCTNLCEHLDILHRILADLCCEPDVPVHPFSTHMEALHTTLQDIVQLTDRLAYLIHLPRIDLENDQVAIMRSYREDLRKRRDEALEQVPALWNEFDSLAAYKKLAATAIAPRQDSILQ